MYIVKIAFKNKEVANILGISITKFGKLKKVAFTERKNSFRQKDINRLIKVMNK